METQESLGGPPGNTRWVGNRRERPRWLYSVCKSDTCYTSLSPLSPLLPLFLPEKMCYDVRNRECRTQRTKRKALAADRASPGNTSYLTKWPGPGRAQRTMQIQMLMQTKRQIRSRSPPRRLSSADASRGQRRNLAMTPFVSQSPSLSEERAGSIISAIEQCSAYQQPPDLSIFAYCAWFAVYLSR